VIYFSLRENSTRSLGGPRGRSAAMAQPVVPMQDDKLEPEGTLDRIVDFARWTRILRVVR
jgi:hypothetical protein